MLLYVDGPEKAGKTHLLANVMEGFDYNHRRAVKQNGRDSKNGMGYHSQAVNHWDSRSVVSGWDRGWVSEVVYGTLLNQQRLFALDPHWCEWVYGRPLIGRGGRFILLPDEGSSLVDRRDETDLDVSPFAEITEFRNHGLAYGYTILTNRYDIISLAENVKTMRRAALLGLHHLDSDEYVGPLNPRVTFIGPSCIAGPRGFGRRSVHGSLKKIPMANQYWSKMFSRLGAQSITEFGYATPESYLANKNKHPQLFERVFTVGDEAAEVIPNEWNIPVSGKQNKMPTEHNEIVFVGEIMKSMEERKWDV